MVLDVSSAVFIIDGSEIAIGISVIYRAKLVVEICEIYDSVSRSL